MATYGHTFTSGDTLTPTKLNDARTATDIVNADISSTAAIAATKLALSPGTHIQTVQTVKTGSQVINGNVVANRIPLDDTIPQITEGAEVMTATITPTSSANKVLVRVQLSGQQVNSGQAIIALFRGASSSAIAASNGVGAIEFLDSPNTTSATTYSVRCGPEVSFIIGVNDWSSARLFGGVSASTLTLVEIQG
jgi:hypothetical protein